MLDLGAGTPTVIRFDTQGFEPGLASIYNFITAFHV